MKLNGGLRMPGWDKAPADDPMTEDDMTHLRKRLDETMPDLTVVVADAVQAGLRRYMGDDAPAYRVAVLAFPAEFASGAFHLDSDGDIHEITPVLNLLQALAQQFAKEETEKGGTG